MKHTDIENLIQKQLDREITPEESKVLQDHLISCPDCRALCSDFVRTTEQISGLVEIFPRQDFSERVLRRLGLRKQPALTKLIPAAAGTWFAASLTACLTLIILFGRPVLAKLFMGIPDAVRLIGKAQTVFDGLAHMVGPLVRLAPSPLYAAVALVFGLFMFFFFGRLAQKPRPVPNLS